MYEQLGESATQPAREDEAYSEKHAVPREERPAGQGTAPEGRRDGLARDALIASGLDAVGLARPLLMMTLLPAHWGPFPFVKRRDCGVPGGDGLGTVDDDDP